MTSLIPSQFTTRSQFKQSCQSDGFFKLLRDTVGMTHSVGLALLSAFIRRYIEDWYQCHVNYCRVTFLVEATRPANLIVADQVPVHLSSRICCRWTFPRSISNGSRPLKHKPRSRAYPITLIFAKLSGLVSRSRRPRFRPLVQAQSM